MKMVRLLKLMTLTGAVSASVMFLGCGTDNDNGLDYPFEYLGIIEPSGGCEYSSSGEWPAYSGHWESILNAAGSKHNDRAYLDVTINIDGTFSGTYQSYVYDYTWNMPTHIGSIPIQVYNPGLNKKAVCGVIDFDERQGEVSFAGRGQVSFELEIIDGDEMALVFPDSFSYSLANIQY